MKDLAFWLCIGDGKVEFMFRVAVITCTMIVGPLIVKPKGIKIEILETHKRWTLNVENSSVPCVVKWQMHYFLFHRILQNFPFALTIKKQKFLQWLPGFMDCLVKKPY